MLARSILEETHFRLNNLFNDKDENGVLDAVSRAIDDTKEAIHRFCQRQKKKINS